MILGAAEVFGEEPEGAEPHGGDVGEVPERDRRRDGCRESPVARPPPGGKKDEGIELHQHGGAERDARAHGRPALAPGERREHQGDHDEVDVARLNPFEDHEW